MAHSSTLVRISSLSILRLISPRVGESLVTLHDEVEAALADWEDLERAGKDTDSVRSYILSAMDCLHDVIAPKLGIFKKKKCS